MRSEIWFNGNAASDHLMEILSGWRRTDARGKTRFNWRMWDLEMSSNIWWL